VGRVGNSTYLYGDGLGDALSVSRYWLALAHVSDNGQVTIALGQSRKESGLHSHTPISTVGITLSILPNSKKKHRI